MILEGLISTVDGNNLPHLAAMGALVDDSLARFELRPFAGSTTYTNLIQHDEAVFHLTDDVEVLVATVTGAQPSAQQWLAARSVRGFILKGVCRWFELKVGFRSLQSPRATLNCRVSATDQARPFSGFNRGKNLILEAAILATRLDFIPREELRDKWRWFRPIIEKTGGPGEQRAFARLTQFVDSRLGEPC